MSEGLGKRIQRLRGEERVAAIREVVLRWEASDASKVAFCEAEGIATVTLGRWLRSLRGEAVADRSSPVLVEVGHCDGPVRDGYEVMLPGGARVRVPAGFCEADLARVLRVLSASC